jgi:hypothetical protein
MVKENMMRHSGNYIGTLSSYDEAKIGAARAEISIRNALSKLKGSDKRWVLKVRPRLGRNSPFRHLYALGGPLHRYSSQDIKREHGARFDMYVYRRYDYRY